MRCLRPVHLVATPIPHKNAAKVQDGFYLLAVTVDGDRGMMSSVLDVSDENGHGVEISAATRSDGAVFDVRVLVEQSARPLGHQPTSYTIWETLSQPTSLTCRRGTCATLNQESPGIFVLKPEPPFSVNLSALGNVVCVHCGKRARLYDAVRANEPCLCGALFPELKIPLALPMAPTTPIVISQ